LPGSAAWVSIAWGTGITGVSRMSGVAIARLLVTRISVSRVSIGGDIHRQGSRTRRSDSRNRCPVAAGTSHFLSTNPALRLCVASRSWLRARRACSGRSLEDPLAGPVRADLVETVEKPDRAGYRSPPGLRTVYRPSDLLPGSARLGRGRPDVHLCRKGMPALAFSFTMIPGTDDPFGPCGWEHRFGHGTRRT
jgi:hypothetical protein